MGWPTYLEEKTEIIVIFGINLSSSDGRALYLLELLFTDKDKPTRDVQGAPTNSSK